MWTHSHCHKPMLVSLLLGKRSETDRGFLTMSQSLLRNIKWQNIFKILMGSDFKFLFVHLSELLCITFSGRKEHSLWHAALSTALTNSEAFTLVVFPSFLLPWTLATVLGFLSMWCRAPKDPLFGAGEVRFKITNDKQWLL